MKRFLKADKTTIPGLLHTVVEDRGYSDLFSIFLRGFRKCPFLCGGRGSSSSSVIASLSS